MRSTILHQRIYFGEGLRHDPPDYFQRQPYGGGTGTARPFLPLGQGTSSLWPLCEILEVSRRVHDISADSSTTTHSSRV
jgi:hypothetical protein